MLIKRGQEYKGPGCADPKKTKDQRSDELQQLMQTEAGRKVVEYYFLKYMGALQGRCPPAGLSMLQTILDHEYPNG